MHFGLALSPTWWSTARLDRDIADGADPASDPRRAERAGGLVTMRMRTRIARSIDRVMEEADSVGLGMSSEAPAQNRFVRDSLPALQTLRDALVADGPVDPRGVALSLELLTDTSGPLYAAADALELSDAALTAVAALQNGRSPRGSTSSDHRQCTSA
jgi:hypothetical protein